MNKLFHRGYFKEIFRQLKTAGIVGACFLMLSNISVAIDLLAQRDSNFINYSIPEGFTLSSPMMAFIYVMGAVLAFNAFGWLNKRSTSDFYHSIPVKRTALYGSTLLAVFAWLMIGLAAFAVVTLLIYTVSGAPFNYYLYACVLVNMVIAALEVIGAGAIACAISGTRFVDLIATAVILFIPRFLFTVLGVFTARFGHESLVIPTISPIFNASYNIIATPYAFMLRVMGWDEYALDYANGWAMLYNLVYSLILIFVGGIAFNKRKSEHAGMATTKGIFQLIIRTAIGLPFLLLMVFILKDNGEFNTGSIVLILLSFVAYCLYELISTKSAKKMLKAMPLYVICLAISGLFLVLPGLISRIELSKNADTSNIKGFTVMEEEGHSYLSDIFDDGLFFGSGDYVSAMQNRIVLNDPKGIELIAKAYSFTSSCKSGSGSIATVKIYRKGLARPITRQLVFSGVDLNKLLQIRNSSEEYRTLVESFPDGRNWFISGPFTKSESNELGSLFKEEFEALNGAEKEMIRSFYYPEAACMHLIGYKGTDNYSSFYRLTDKTPRTTSRYFELINRDNESEVKKTIRDIIHWMQTGEDEEYFNLTIYDPRSSEDEQCLLSIASYGMRYYNQNGNGLPMKTDAKIYDLLTELADVPLDNDSTTAYLLEIFDWDDFHISASTPKTRIAVRLTEEQLKLLYQTVEDYGFNY